MDRTGSVIQILRNTLRRLDQGSDFRRDDPAVIQLKRHLVQSIAELEMMKDAPSEPLLAPESESEAPITVLRIR
jgi:hypothetical protein